MGYLFLCYLPFTLCGEQVLLLPFQSYRGGF